MSGRGFESLCYTDRGPGDREGAELRASSAGATGEMRALVERAAVYEAPVGWQWDANPADRPPSLAHAVDGVYVTARGVHVASGEWEGSRFTHAVATIDPQRYGPIRPAQLWDAPWWSDEPPEGECEQVPAEPEPGPWAVDLLREWVLGLPDAEQRLTALLSALDRVHDRGGRRVVFVGPDPGEVVRWIAVATLLMPQERALRIGFRVYATDPQHSDHQVLALHPDWADRFAEAGRGDDFAVFNLVTGSWSAVEPTESAVHWVPRFLRADPYDVVDAVELAHRFARDRGSDRARAADRIVAGALVFGEPVDSHAEELTDWLADAPSSTSADTVERVARAVVQAGPDVAVLRKLAITVHDGHHELAGRVRYALLWAEVDEIARGVAVERDPLPERPWTPEEREKATDLVEAAAAGADPERLDALLRLAARHGLEPRPARFSEAAAGFAAWWADNPGAVDPGRWSCAPPLIGLLRERLASRSENEAAIREHWWPLFVSSISDPFARFDAAVAGAAVEHGGRSREDAIEAMLVPLGEPDRPGVGDAVWDALFAHTGPTLDEMLRIFSGMPTATVSETLAQKALSVLGKAQVSARYLDLLRLLVEHIRAESLLALWKEDGTLRRWLTSLQRGKESESPPELKDVSKPVLAARGPGIAAALLDAGTAKAVAAVVKGGEVLQQVLVRELKAVWTDDPSAERRDAAVALAFLTGWSDDVSQTMRSEFDKALEEWAGGHGQVEYRNVSRLLRAVDADGAAGWHEWLRELAKKKPKKHPLARRLFERLRDR
ncbi:GTPase-associated protein 1-related protein [Saccharopolyspora taberi]|uniref:Uncharacterized protein n=1 Tax=Saccharopolyspora taberi TaxID=60895 RepID=A0ABN3VNA2_9PSEU